MPVEVDCTFRRVNTRVEISALNCRNTTLLAWWYCGVYKNRQDGTQPLVLVAFRTQIGKKVFSDELVYRYVSIALLGQVRLGSLCRDNKVIGYANYETRDFNVRYLEGDWRFASFHDSASTGKLPPFPLTIYPIAYKRDKNWMVEFNLDEGRLLIPSLEYFTRCYGQSAELRRILVTYPWDLPGGGLDRLYAPINEPEDPNGRVWKVKLRKGLYNGDTVFLAHVKYHRDTELLVKDIHSSIDTQYSADATKAAFARIGPWYTGVATLRVGGIPFNDGRSFLGLQVLGSTEPAGTAIERSRDNRGNALTPADPAAQGNAWAGAPARWQNERPEPLSLSMFEAPDNGGDSIELEDPEFVVLGPRRVVRTHRDEQAQSSGGPRAAGEGADTFSAGEAYGSGKGVGRASVKTELLLESEGALRDMWNAMQHMRELYPEALRSVEWYMASGEFSQSQTPELIALEPFDEEELSEGDPIPTATRNWLYMDLGGRSEPRGLLIARMNVSGTYVYIVEIQRRPCKRKTAYGVLTESEESFRGLVFTLNHQSELHDWLRFVRSNVRRVRGVVYKLTKDCPGKADTFRHDVSSKDEVACWSALVNALKKVDIQLK